MAVVSRTPGGFRAEEDGWKDRKKRARKNRTVSTSYPLYHRNIAIVIPPLHSPARDISDRSIDKQCASTRGLQRRSTSGEWGVRGGEEVKWRRRRNSRLGIRVRTFPEWRRARLQRHMEERKNLRDSESSFTVQAVRHRRPTHLSVATHRKPCPIHPS